VCVALNELVDLALTSRELLVGHQASPFPRSNMCSEL
jgi:hypothetical protein